MKKKFFILVGLIFLLTMVQYCNVSSKPALEGSLKLEISSSGVENKTIVPPTSMIITSYDILGSGPDKATFQQLGVTGTTANIKALAVGSWVVTVNAKNVEGVLIATGNTSVTITAGQTTTAQVVVLPIDGIGTLKLLISWPTGMIAVPSVAGTLTSTGGATNNLSFIPGGNGNSASSENSSLNSGYYTLTLILLDGATVVWGSTRAVRIVAGQTTEGIFNLLASDINPVGSVNVSITPSLQNPIQITLSGQQAFLAFKTDMTVTATTSPAVGAYRWYLNGSLLQNETGSSITLGAALAKGNYTLDLVVTSGTILSSESISFTVTNFARNPVFFVHGHGVVSGVWTTLINNLVQQLDYPPQFLRAIQLNPSDGSNIPAAETQIAPAIETFLSEVNQFLALQNPKIPSKTKVDLVSHSMGGLSARWYTARVRPDRVHTWLSLAGANHGTNALAGWPGGGADDLTPAFALNESESYIQFQLNGLPFVADVDETPYGIGVDTLGVTVVPPDSNRRIHYTTIRTTPDPWIVPIESGIVDGAGGISITIPPDLPATLNVSGDFVMSNGVGHDEMLPDPNTMRLVGIILSVLNY